MGVLEESGVVEGRGKLLNNLAACYLQQDKPYAALEACEAALRVRLSWPASRRDHKSVTR